MSKGEAGDAGREAGGKHLDAALRSVGFRGNADLSRATGVSEGLLWKYRNGRVRPNNENLGKIVAVITDAAEPLGLYFDPVEFYVRFGLISRDELEQEPVDELFVDLIELDRQTEAVSDFEHELFRQQLRGLIDLTRERVKRASEARRQTG
jgi:transcriptional regulator with XRE-family HTH domain